MLHSLWLDWSHIKPKNKHEFDNLWQWNLFSSEDWVLEEIMTCIPLFGGVQSLQHWHAEEIYILSATYLNSLAVCNDQGLITMSTQFLLLVCVTCSLEKRVAFLQTPDHPPTWQDLYWHMWLKIPLLPWLVFACNWAHNLWALIPMPQPISPGWSHNN
jgi:hypothetical protein